MGHIEGADAFAHSVEVHDSDLEAVHQHAHVVIGIDGRIVCHPLQRHFNVRPHRRHGVEVAHGQRLVRRAPVSDDVAEILVAAVVLERRKVDGTIAPLGRERETACGARRGGSPVIGRDAEAG